MRSALAVCLLLANLAGCGLYFGGDDDPPCYPYGAAETDAIYYELRDPTTGQCVPSNPYPYPCDDRCGPCAYDAGGGAAQPQSQPNWGACYGMCSGLDESTCQATAGCYAAYLHEYADESARFWGCWETAPSGPVGGSCYGLDAQECSQHDNCTAKYQGGEYSAKFSSCSEETALCANIDCGPGYRCEEQCWGDTDGNGPNPGEMDFCSGVCVQNTTCSTVLCAPNTVCVEQCETDADGQWFCHPSCVPSGTDPGSCTGNVWCNALPPACPQGTTAGIANGCYTGYCIPNHDCGPNDPGECTGNVACDALPPACPANTVPGISGSCWSGYCIPTSSCPDPACESLTTETACTSRMDCSPVYTGSDCTCSPNGCTCQTLSFARCETLYMPF